MTVPASGSRCLFASFGRHVPASQERDQRWSGTAAPAKSVLSRPRQRPAASPDTPALMSSFSGPLMVGSFKAAKGTTHHGSGRTENGFESNDHRDDDRQDHHE